MHNARHIAALLLATGFLCASLLHSQDAPAQANEVPRVMESEEQLGAFALGSQTFTLTARSQTISPSSDRRFATTVSELAIRDASAGVVYEEDFSSSIVDGRFLQTLAVTASLLEGAGGRALVLRFLENSGPQGGSESWQVFGLVNGKLVKYGAPRTLGEGGVAVNGVLTGVMLSGGIGVVPLASRAEALEFRVWAGHFFISVPVRIEWQQGIWSEGEQCFSNESGGLRRAGCNLRVTVSPQRVAEGAVVTLYAQPEENAYSARQVAVRGNSAVEFASARGIVKWQDAGDRFTCSFDDLWLRVRIDGNEGWVRPATDFAGLGLSTPGAGQ